jgi:hypothetical protein
MDIGIDSVSIASMSIAIRNNVNYQHQIIQKNFCQNAPTVWNNVLTESNKNGIEDWAPQYNDIVAYVTKRKYKRGEEETSLRI